ncbi:hypothetical protein LOAG_02380 [Loa loa]|uniref:Uncharacterized protein n=1 Tax=Loa loa TaxID=7209 RepID=A0A1S0U6T5_LOALO|nr:hypothetical protein LOAG_02380 [Loa loa]EFO26112.1 hypothetical protein LOAG_02380 [Loa loa]
MNESKRKLGDGREKKGTVQKPEKRKIDSDNEIGNKIIRIDLLKIVFKILVEINFAHTTQIISLTGFFEGKFRTKISNQVEFRQIIAFRIEFDTLIRQWRTQNGEIYAPAGQHKTEIRLVIGEECPESYLGKYGSIEYLTAVKLCIPGRTGHSKLVQIRPVRVIAVMDITRYLPFHIPVHIERYFHKKFFVSINHWPKFLSDYQNQHLFEVNS